MSFRKFNLAFLVALIPSALIQQGIKFVNNFTEDLPKNEYMDLESTKMNRFVNKVSYNKISYKVNEDRESLINSIYDPNSENSAKLLEEYGIYEFEKITFQYNQDDYIKEPKEYFVNRNRGTQVYAAVHSPSSMSFFNMSLLYDSVAREWTFRGEGFISGQVNSRDAASIWWPTVGSTYNVGGDNVAGINLFDTSGTFNSRIVRQNVVTHTFTTIDNRMARFFVRDFRNSVQPLPHSVGTGIFINDRINILTVNRSLGIPTTFTYMYENHSFALSVTYDNNFSNFQGLAALFYAHNWDRTFVNSISLGGDSIGVSWERGRDGWVAQAPTAIRF